MRSLAFKTLESCDFSASLMPGLEVDFINKRSLFYRYCDCHYCHLTDPFLIRVGSELTHLTGYVLSGITPILCRDRVGNGHLVPIAKELGS